METRQALTQSLIQNFLKDLTESVKLLNHGQTIDFIATLQEYLLGVYNFEMPNPEYDYDGYPFDEDDFIENRFLKPYREKMVPFIKTNLRYYFAKEEFGKTLLFRKLKITEPILNDDEYEIYINWIFLKLKKIKENLYLKPEDEIAVTVTQDQSEMEKTDEIISKRIKSKNTAYTRDRQILLFYFLSKLAGMNRNESTARRYAQFAHFLFYYPTDNIDGSDVYKMFKKAPYIKDRKPLLKDLEFVKQLFELIEHAEGKALVQKEIDLLSPERLNS